MSQPIVKPDSQLLSPEKEQIFYTYLDRIATKIATYTSGREFTPFRIVTKVLDENDNLVPVMEEEITDQKVDFLQTALENPHLIQGLFMIINVEETILHIERGKVIEDTLGLTLKYPLEKQLVRQENTHVSDATYKEIAGKDLIKYGYGVLAFFGRRLVDGSMSYETEQYLYTESAGQLKIFSKAECQEVLNNDGFTEAANERDVITLVKMKENIEQYKLNNPPPSIPGFKL